MNSKDGGPAFPCDQIELGDRTARSEGMSLRDYFAAKAMQALVQAVSTAGAIDSTELIAPGAYEIADAMLKARSA